MREELEVPVNNSPYVIGVNNNYPVRLREMVSAASITYQLQNNSIDYVLKKYFKTRPYEEDPGGTLRSDRRCRCACEAVFSAADKFLEIYPPLTKRSPTIGEWIGDLTLVRTTYSFERAFAEADKGALYECVAIGRMILEQISWIWSVRSLDDTQSIERKSATRAVGELTRLLPIAGRLYGWMSDHAHWAYSAHLKAITKKDNQSAAMLASSLFKAIGYSMLIVLSELYLRVVSLVVKLERGRALTEHRRAWSAATKKFKPKKLLKEIAEVSEFAADIVGLQKILLDGPRHG